MDLHSERVSEADRTEILSRILMGSVSRASILLYLWSLIAFLYGFASIELFRKHIPDITYFDNVAPRVLFSCLPMLLIGRWYKSYRNNTVIKAYSTIVVFPLLLLLASFVHAIPLFVDGHHDFYLYFHSANIIAMFSAVSLVSAPTHIVLAQIFSFIVIFFGPLIYIFRGDSSILQLIGSDVLMLSLALFIGQRSAFTIRLKIATEDVLRRRKAAPFLGENLAKAIYESKEMEVHGYTQPGAILAMDLRGYTNFVHSNDQKVVKQFMSQFHAHVARALGEAGGYLHKTSGDGVLCSFGVMTKEEDLSDIPGIEGELAEASKNRKRLAFMNGIKAFQSILKEFENLKAEHGIQSDLMVGAGIAFGEIEVVVRGDANFRQELDIDGETIVRAVRLESYSKLLNKMVDHDSSFLVIAPELFDSTDDTAGTKVWLTNTPALAVRDYPNIKSVMFRQWKHNRTRTQRSAA